MVIPLTEDRGTSPCHYAEEKGRRFLVPGCYQAAQGGDCTCRNRGSLNSVSGRGLLMTNSEKLGREQVIKDLARRLDAETRDYLMALGWSPIQKHGDTPDLWEHPHEYRVATTDAALRDAFELSASDE